MSANDEVKKLYEKLSDPETSDAEFDRLLFRLEQLRK